LSVPVDEPGAITLYDHPDPHGHMDLAASLTSEKQVEKWVKGKGSVVVWERITRNAHYLDAGYEATAAADFIRQSQQLATPAKPPSLAELAAQAQRS